MGKKKGWNASRVSVLWCGVVRGSGAIQGVWCEGAANLIGQGQSNRGTEARWRALRCTRTRGWAQNRHRHGHARHSRKSLSAREHSTALAVL